MGLNWSGKNDRKPKAGDESDGNSLETKTNDLMIVHDHENPVSDKMTLRTLARLSRDLERYARWKARFIGSMLCEMQEIEKELKLVAQQGVICPKQRKYLRLSCEMYDWMKSLITDWRSRRLPVVLYGRPEEPKQGWTSKMSDETNERSSSFRSSQLTP